MIKYRTYTCKTITHMYVLRFMNRYSSEVYHIFSDLLPRLNNNDLILSLGCGPSFETVALEKYSRDNSIGKIRYLGIDSNQIWEDVSASCCLNKNHFGKKSVDCIKLSICSLDKSIPEYTIKDFTVLFVLYCSAAE